MSTTISNRYIVDLPEWRALSSPILNTSTTPFSTSGAVMAPDMRGRDYANPNVVFNWSGIASTYNFKLDSWNYVISLAMGGTLGAGSTAVFCPKLSPSGSIAAGATYRSFTIAAGTPLPSTGVATNWMAQRGDGLGHIVRIIDNGPGGTGRTEERRVISNTSGNTPIVYLDKDLSFVPVTGSTFEFLSGSVLFLNTGGGSTANIFRRYDLLTNTITSLSTTTGTFIGTIPATYNQLVATDEQYVPYNRNPGEGFIVGTSTYDTSGDFSKNCLLSTATAATSITGQASGGDAGVLADQFRNYQIRIVEDSGQPAAVGQRRRITTHTAGVSPVYTVAAWTTQPSAVCKFVIENNTDNIIGFFQGSTATYNYTISGNSWNTTTWASRPTAMSTGGITWHAFGISPIASPGNDLRPSNIISFRGGGSAVYDIFDISGAATGSWPGSTTGYGITFNGNSGSGSLIQNNDPNYFAYNPHTQEGKYMYFALGSNTNYGIQRGYARFDSASGIVSWVAGPKIQQGTAALATSACYAHCCVFQDGNTKVAFYNTPRFMSSQDYMQLMLTF